MYGEDYVRRLSTSKTLITLTLITDMKHPIPQRTVLLSRISLMVQNDVLDVRDQTRYDMSDMMVVLHLLAAASTHDTDLSQPSRAATRTSLFHEVTGHITPNKPPWIPDRNEVFP